LNVALLVRKGIGLVAMAADASTGFALVVVVLTRALDSR